MRMNEEYQKILVHCPNWVGDVVMATPALRTIRENNPRAHITIMVRPHIREVVDGLPFFDEIIEYDSTAAHRSFMQKYRISTELRKKRFDLSIILPNSFSSAALSRMASISRRVGYRTNGRGFLLTHSVPPPTESGKIVPIPMVERYLALCEHLQYSVSSRDTALSLADGVRREVATLLDCAGVKRDTPMVSIIPGASFGSSKCWPAEHFAQVGDALIEQFGVHVLIIPGPGEETIARRIDALMKQRPVTFADTIISLEQLKAVISDSALVVTNDTGPRHYAVAFHRPVVVIMGPTDPRYTNYGLEKTRVLRSDLACSPCHRKVCPTDHGCMRSITPEQVVKACQEFLGMYRNSRDLAAR